MNFFLQWLVQTHFRLVSNSSSIEACRQMCSEISLFWRLPERKLSTVFCHLFHFLDSINRKESNRNFPHSKNYVRSDLDVLRMYDKELYDRDIETGWIRGFSNERREESYFFSREKNAETTPIMKKLVVIDDICLRNGMIIYDPQDINSRDCINYRSFFVGLDL